MTDVLPDPPIASGRTADVHAWGEGSVLKLFHPWFDLESIQYEQRITRAVCASGVAAPQVGELVQVGERYGLTYQRVDGPSMLDLLQRKPWTVFACARALAELQAQMHASVFESDIPSQRERLAYKLEHAAALSAAVRTSLLNRLASMPTGAQVCHGDFHPGNVIMTAQGGVAIDWIDASRGNPLADAARTSIILQGLAAGEISNPILKQFARVFHAAYLRHYFHQRPQGREEFRRWLPIVAGARLSEDIQEIESWLLEQAGKSQV
ncbi:MAG: phosphotransferase [Chloroflexi bacterium]|nr:phosphotransferase [Chloroflexota bacterium]